MSISENGTDGTRRTIEFLGVVNPARFPSRLYFRARDLRSYAS